MPVLNFKRIMQKRLVLSLLCLFMLAACAPSQSGDPAAAVEAYYKALVKNDTAQISQLVCPDYEAGAKTEFDSIGAIGNVTLDNLKCTSGTVSGDSATVTCTGS